MPPTNFPHDARFTPKWLAHDMVAMAFIKPRHLVLEPSAGDGALVDAIHRWSEGTVTAVELNTGMIELLRDTNATVHHADFLNWIPHCKFNRVVMNPPKEGSKHVLRAAELLVSGGRLVALMHLDQAQIVLSHLEGVRIYGLPTNMFHIHGSPIEAAILIWDKP